MSATLEVRNRAGWTVTDGAGLVNASKFGDTGQPDGLLNLANGTGDNEFDTLYRKAFTIAAGGTLTIDLKGGGGELDALNVALTLQKVRWIYLGLTTTPATGVSLRIGPQNVANSFQGPFGDTGATAYLTVQDYWDMDAPVDGWTVDATHKILTIYNPGAASVSGVLLVAGVHT